MNTQSVPRISCAVVQALVTLGAAPLLSAICQVVACGSPLESDTMAEVPTVNPLRSWMSAEFGYVVDG